MASRAGLGWGDSGGIKTCPGTVPGDNRKEQEMLSVFLQVVRLAARYGKRVVDWVTRNRDRIFQWIRDGLALDAIIARVKQILGIK